jgi:peptidyl-prolyl cis-trans isomerase B (cyclophilin B)
MNRFAIAVFLIMLVSAPLVAQPAKTSPGAGPVVVLETTKGTIEFETYPNEAPKTVAHILGLVKRNFYNGIRVHRVVKGFVVQFGDPQTRDVTKKEMWGKGPGAGSGKPIGVAEMNPKRTHVLGAVAMAHAGDPARADSQMYITLAPVHRLDKDYTVFGKVISGMDVVQRIEEGDMIKKATVRDGAQATSK